MSDKAYESLSALMDNETDDLEVRRILKQYSDQPDMREKWVQYQLVSSSISAGYGAKDNEAVAPFDIDLSDKIAAQIALEPSHQSSHVGSKQKKSRFRLLKPMGSVAIAASVTFLVVIGAQRVSITGTDVGQSPQYASQKAQPAFQVPNSVLAGQRPTNGSASAQLASSGNSSSGWQSTKVAPTYIDGQKSAAQVVTVVPIENVNLYLQQHARNAAISGVGGAPFARTAAFKIEE